MWGELERWHKKMNPWFAAQLEITSTSLYMKGAQRTQFAVARTAKRENPDALQGFHAPHLLYLVDEASGVPETVFQTAEGALSTPEARVLMAANPTQLDGYFYDAHHKNSDHWTLFRFSSEDSPLVAKEYVETMREKYGEDSDVYRVRVQGKFPRAAINQLIPEPIYEACANKHLPQSQYIHEPVILACDPAWEGDDASCLYMRQGLLATKLGEWRNIDNMTLADIIIREKEQRGAAATFIDTGWGAGIIDRLRSLGHDVTPVHFGGVAGDSQRYADKRTEMWCDMLAWMKRGASFEHSARLKQDMMGPRYYFTPGGKIRLESKKDMKKRGLDSPDEGDAIALTFASPVLPTALASAAPQMAQCSYNPLQRVRHQRQQATSTYAVMRRRRR
jgi:hypothetical protein